MLRWYESYIIRFSFLFYVLQTFFTCIVLNSIIFSKNRTSKFVCFVSGSSSVNVNYLVYHPTSSITTLQRYFHQNNYWCFLLLKSSTKNKVSNEFSPFMTRKNFLKKASFIPEKTLQKYNTRHFPFLSAINKSFFLNEKRQLKFRATSNFISFYSKYTQHTTRALLQQINSNFLKSNFIAESVIKDAKCKRKTCHIGFPLYSSVKTANTDINELEQKENALLLNNMTFSDSYDFSVNPFTGRMRKKRHKATYNYEIRELLRKANTAQSSLDLLSKIDIKCSLFPLPYPVAAYLLTHLGNLFEREQLMWNNDKKKYESIFSLLQKHPKYKVYFRSILSCIYTNAKTITNKSYLCIRKKGNLVMNAYPVSATEMQQILAALSKLGLKDERKLLQVFLRAIRIYFSHFTLLELVSVMESLAYLKLEKGKPFMISALSRIKAEKIENLDDALLIKILKAFASLSLVDLPFFKKLSEYFLIRIQSLDAFQCSSILKSFSEIEYFNEELYDKLSIQFLNKVHSVSHPKNLFIKVLIAMSSMNFKQDLLLMHISKEICKSLNSFTMEELSIILRSYAILNCYSYELFNSVFNLHFFNAMSTNETTSPENKLIHSSSKSNQDEEDISDLSLSRFYQAYIGFKIESPFADEFSLPLNIENKLKKMYYDDKNFSLFHPSSLHSDIAQIFEELFLPNHIEYVTPEGLKVDLAIFVNSLKNKTNEISSNKNNLFYEQNIVNNSNKYAFEVDGPFKFLQKSLQQFPPKLNGATEFKQRLLKALGWHVVSIPYWIVTYWYTPTRKAELIKKILPKELLEIVEHRSKNKTAQEEPQKNYLDLKNNLTKNEDSNQNYDFGEDSSENEEKKIDVIAIKPLNKLLEEETNVSKMMGIIQNTLEKPANVDVA